MNPRIDTWQGKRVWIVGASTGIGAALVKPLAQAGAQLAVSARREQPLLNTFDRALALDAGQIEAAGHKILPMDVTQPDDVRRAHDILLAQWGSIDLVLWVAGTYAAMQAETFDHARAVRVVDTNLGGILNGLAVILPTLLRQKHGGIAIVSSVAGYSGLPKALVFGPTKSALINLCESLYLDLHPLGIGVTLICPGFVDTPLTEGNNFKMPALITADEAAGHIIAGLVRGAFEIHFPRRFTLWLKLMRILPYWLYMPLVARATKNDRKPHSATRLDRH